MRARLIHVDRGGSVAARLPLRGALVIGRDRTADLVLDAPGVSRQHARIAGGPLRYDIEDLGSANGTMWFSRWREFHADAGAAELAGRQKMIAALKRLQSVNDPQDLPGEFSSFGISGGIGSGLKSLFMSHPPLEKRIKALEASTNVVNRQ